MYALVWLKMLRRVYNTHATLEVILLANYQLLRARKNLIDYLKEANLHL